MTCAVETSVEDLQRPMLLPMDESRGIEKKRMEMKEAVEQMLAKDRSLDGGSTLLQPYESQAAPIARITVWGILERPTTNDEAFRTTSQ